MLKVYISAPLLGLRRVDSQSPSRMRYIAHRCMDHKPYESLLAISVGIRRTALKIVLDRETRAERKDLGSYFNIAAIIAFDMFLRSTYVYALASLS